MKKLLEQVKWKFTTTMFVSLLCLQLFASPDKAAKGQQTADHSSDLPYAKDAANLAKATDNLKSGKYRANDVELVARMGAVQAIPALEELYRKTADPEDKQKIAYGLVRLKDADDTYWNYLSARATDAIHRGAPDPLRYDSDGKVIQDRPSDAFADWAARNKLDVKTAFDQVFFKDVGSVIDLAASKDQRAVPLLRTALALPDHTLQTCQMQITAANGLADLHDKGSISLIISASAKAPKDCSVAIAQSLVYFDEGDAQQAADIYLPAETAKALRAKRAQGLGPFD